MPVWLIATTVHLFAVFVQSGPLDDIRVYVQLIKVDSDQLTSGVVPRAGSDPIASGNGSPFRNLSADICSPGALLGSGSLSQGGAMGIGAVKAAKVAAIPDPNACYEKNHWIVACCKDRCSHRRQYPG